MNVTALAAPFESGSAEPKPKNIAEAAKQFEAILIAQMLRSAQESSQSEDATGQTMLDLASQHFAQVLANSGGLGLSKLIVKGLPPAAVTPPASVPPAGVPPPAAVASRA